MAPKSRYTVEASAIDRIITHRASKTNSETSQYLVLWKSEDNAYPPLSWHDVRELSGALHIVQQYLQEYNSNLKSEQSASTKQPVLQQLAGTKRKRGERQLLTPDSSHSPGKSTSPRGAEDTSKTGNEVFNCFLRRKEGLLSPVPITTGQPLDVRKLPTLEMQEQARAAETTDAENIIRKRYVSRLEQLRPPVRFDNKIDLETPSLAFKFISKYVLREGVTRQDLVMGCTNCKPNMATNKGCEYTKVCECLEFAAPAFKNDEQRAEYERQVRDNGFPPTENISKRFPYISSGDRAGCLVDFYLCSRHVVYECNDACACGPHCKNRNAQHGRRVKLEIFKTSDSRGFGLRCLQPLRRGQFIDTYLGEVITVAEADRREQQASSEKASYLFWLDKFNGQQEIRPEDTFVVDGEFMGGPTRFINHSCEPNMQMHTVSYNKYDYYVYDLAFFANRDIPAGTELTFDYKDADVVPGDSAMQESQEREDGKTKTECRCGAANCRGFLWV